MFSANENAGWLINIGECGSSFYSGLGYRSPCTPPPPTGITTPGMQRLDCFFRFGCADRLADWKMPEGHSRQLWVARVEDFVANTVLQLLCRVTTCKLPPAAPGGQPYTTYPATSSKLNKKVENNQNTCFSGFLQKKTTGRVCPMWTPNLCAKTGENIMGLCQKNTEICKRMSLFKKQKSIENIPPPAASSTQAFPFCPGGKAKIRS